VFYLIKGRLVLMQQPKAARRAQQYFSAANEIAQKSGAKSLELRATTELARVLISQNRREQARVRLTKTYNWFTEGFDTADLKEAKTPLDQLSD
jgi:predicted ATPase